MWIHREGDMSYRKATGVIIVRFEASKSGLSGLTSAATMYAHYPLELSFWPRYVNRCLLSWYAERQTLLFRIESQISETIKVIMDSWPTLMKQLLNMAIPMALHHLSRVTATKAVQTQNLDFRYKRSTHTSPEHLSSCNWQIRQPLFASHQRTVTFCLRKAHLVTAPGMALSDEHWTKVSAVPPMTARRDHTAALLHLAWWALAQSTLDSSTVDYRANTRRTKLGVVPASSPCRPYNSAWGLREESSLCSP